MTARSGLFVAPASGVGTSPTDGRLALAGLIGTVPQVVQGGTVAQSASTMQFTVAQSVLELPDPTNAAAAFLSPIDQTVITPAAGPTTGSRIDLIVAKQNNPENGDADARANFSLIPGTAGAPGVAPAVPAGFFRFADILVPTNAANAAACTITYRSPTTWAAPDLIAPTFALLNLVTGQLGQSASVTADSTVGLNGTYLWTGATYKWQRTPGLVIGGSIVRTGTAGSFGAGGWTVLNNMPTWGVDQPAYGIAAFNGVWTAPVDGWYDVDAGIQLDAAVNAWLTAKKNSTSADGLNAIASTTAAGVAGTTALTLRRRVRLAAGDTVALALFVSAIAQWSNTNLQASFFGIRFVEALR